MFPRGLPGLALVLLRISVATALLLECYLFRQSLAGWVHAAAIVLAIAVCAGFLTPVAAAAVLVFHVLLWSLLGAGSHVVAAIVALDTIALVFLGPGAYSVDSRRYGRRIVVLSPP